MSEVALESTPDLTINLDNVGTQHHPEHGAKPVNQAENGGGVDGNQVSELDLFPEGYVYLIALPKPYTEDQSHDPHTRE